jgi:hypothetical protein
LERETHENIPIEDYGFIEVDSEPENDDEMMFPQADVILTVLETNKLSDTISNEMIMKI